MPRKALLGILALFGIVLLFSTYLRTKQLAIKIKQSQETQVNYQKHHPLEITEMRKRDYPGSDLKIEENLAPGSNFNQYIASYISDGIKIFGLLTIPTGEKPKNGWPVIIFNHGYINPKIYRTTERYSAYVGFFASNGYIVFKSDYRGHGFSEGSAQSTYYTPDYTVDILNAVSSLKKFPDANPNKVGMWGHSMGGNITLRSMVISKDIKAGVVWAGVVGSYPDLIYRWRGRSDLSSNQRESFRTVREKLLKEYGSPEENPKFWQSIDPIYFLDGISGPVQIHHGMDDETVPLLFSEALKKALEGKNKTFGYYTYPGADHNISGPSFSLAMERSVEFFDKYLKE